MEIVRKLDLSDLDQMVLLRLGLQNYDLKYVRLEAFVTNEELLVQKTKEYIETHLNKNLFMFGLFIDDQLVANCGFYLDEHFPEYVNLSGYCGYICNVFTKEEYRGKGYQKKIFAECLSYAKNLGVISFKLSSKNEAAINMYSSFGFKKINNMYGYYIK